MKATFLTPFLLMTLAPLTCSAHTLTTLYRFKDLGDGGAPAYGAIAENGILYGTTMLGGAKKIFATICVASYSLLTFQLK